MPLIPYYAYRLSRYCRDNISDPRGNITHLGKFTVMPAEQWKCAANPNYIQWLASQLELPDYSCLKLRRSRRYWPPPHPPPPHPSSWPTEGGERQWGRVEWSSEGEGWADSSKETLTEGRHGCPALSLTLGNTGFTSLADKKGMCQWSTGVAWPGGYCEGH